MTGMLIVTLRIGWNQKQLRGKFEKTGPVSFHAVLWGSLDEKIWVRVSASFALHGYNQVDMHTSLLYMEIKK